MRTIRYPKGITMFNRKKKIHKTAMELRTLTHSHIHLETALTTYHDIYNNDPVNESRYLDLIAEVEEARVRLEVAIYRLLGTTFYRKNLEEIVRLANI